MENTNLHIESYLKYYLSLHNPGFAILIKGKWGSGKTFFVKNYFSVWNNQFGSLSSSKESSSVYVSLNGVKNTEEIDKRIFLSLHPKLDKSYTLLFSHLVTGVLKAKGFHSLIEDFKMNDFIKSVKSKQVIIFDDLERCSIPIEESLGYINEFVEHMGLRVVIIANEEDIVAKYPKGSNVQYELIQEKLIGKRFQIYHDSIDILNHFITGLQHPSAKVFVQNKQEVVGEAYQESETENLRILLHGLRDFERLFLKVQSKFGKNKDILERLIQVFFSFHFEINSGRISPKDILSTEAYRWRHYLKNDKKSEPSVIENTMNRYSCLKDQNLVLSAKAWKDWFEKGDISEDSIEESLTQNGLTKKKDPEWVKLWDWMKSDDSSLPLTIEKIQSGLDKKKFSHPAIIAQIAGTLLTLSKVGIYPKRMPEIVTFFKSYIDELGDKIDFLDPIALAHDSHSWAGKGYQSNDTAEFKEIFSHIIKRLSAKEERTLKSLVPKLLSLLQKDSTTFWRKMSASSGGGSLYNKPIFAFISPNEFFKTLLLIPNTHKPDIFYMFKDRYVHARAFPALKKEFEFVKKLDNLVDEYLSENPGKVSSHMLSVGKKNYLSEAMTIINEIENPTPNEEI